MSRFNSSFTVHMTPRYVYNLGQVGENCTTLATILQTTTTASKALYAMMANPHPEILAVMQKHGFGVQISSLGELQLAEEAGFHPDTISCTTTGMSKEMMKKLIEKDIMLNLDSVEEVKKFCSLTQHNTL